MPGSDVTGMNAYPAKMVSLDKLRGRVIEIIVQGSCVAAGCRASKAHQLPGAGAWKPDKAGGVNGHGGMTLWACRNSTACARLYMSVMRSE